MTLHALLILSLSTLVGAVAMARMEAREYAQQRELDHGLLTAIRLAAAGMLIQAFCPPILQWRTAFVLLLMMGLFGPAHRMTLYLTRKYTYPQQNRGLKWWRLGKGWYDRIWDLLPGEKTPIIIMNGTELLIAAAMWIQLKP